jgi:RNA polymerase sigma-70 factor (ECF subfamily)
MQASLSLTSVVADHRQGQLTLEERVTMVFERFRLPVYYYVLVVLGDAGSAEEVSQECFLTLFRVLKAGSTVRDVRLWLFRVAHNLALNRKRSRDRIAALDWPEWSEVLTNRRDPSPNPEQRLLQKERYNSVRIAMMRLTEVERHVVQLRANGLRYREIAGILEISTTTVADALSRAVEKVKAEIHA